MDHNRTWRLTPDDFRAASADAVERQLRVFEHGRTLDHGVTNGARNLAERLINATSGNWAEIAFAGLNGLAWVPSTVELYSNGDVRGVEVRQTMWRNGCLIVWPDDILKNPYRMCLLMTGEYPLLTECGWVHAFRVKRLGKWKTGPENRGHSNWWTEQDKLRPWDYANPLWPGSPGEVTLREASDEEWLGSIKRASEPPRGLAGLPLGSMLSPPSVE